MASRILHLAAAEEIMKRININDKNRFRLGCILPDASNSKIPKSDSHLKVFVCGNSKKTYDLDRFITLFKDEINKNGLYTGYYLHLIQDLIFRELVYDKYKWNPAILENVRRLHNDYHIINLYVIKKYGVPNNIQMFKKAAEDLRNEKLYSFYPFEVEGFLCDMENDFCDIGKEDIYFFTKAMADEFVTGAADACIQELRALENGRHYIESYEHAWCNKSPLSLLKTTQNTRDLGGYKTKEGKLTKKESILRSDIQNYPNKEDFEYLKTRGITTIIDMRCRKEINRKPSGFAGKEGFIYLNFQIEQGSGVPESAEAVPKSYMSIASDKAMTDVFKCIANAASGVMFNCTAGKDRTGVVSAILLCHVGASDKDIVENYVLTKEYGRERLELIHRNFPELDMNIVTPCEMFIEEFLRMFREKYGDTEKYFNEIGLNDKEIRLIREKLVQEDK